MPKSLRSQDEGYSTTSDQVSLLDVHTVAEGILAMQPLEDGADADIFGPMDPLPLVIQNEEMLPNKAGPSPKLADFKRLPKHRRFLPHTADDLSSLANDDSICHPLPRPSGADDETRAPNATDDLKKDPPLGFWCFARAPTSIKLVFLGAVLLTLGAIGLIVTWATQHQDNVSSSSTRSSSTSTSQELGIDFTWPPTLPPLDSPTLSPVIGAGTTDTPSLTPSSELFTADVASSFPSDIPSSIPTLPPTKKNKKKKKNMKKRT